MKKFLLIGLLAMLPLAGCTADRTWSVNIDPTGAYGSHPYFGSCQMAVGHGVSNSPATSSRASLTYGVTVSCHESSGKPFSARVTGYAQLNHDPIIGFGSGQWSPVTITGHANEIWYTRQELHGTFTLFAGGIPFNKAPSGCSFGLTAQILNCSFDNTFTVAPG